LYKKLVNAKSELYIHHIYDKHSRPGLVVIKKCNCMSSTAN